VSPERGATSVELALGMPVLILVILGGVHLGRVVMARHQLADATSYASRAAAIAHATDAGAVRALVRDRLGPTSSCGNVMVTTRTDTDPLGVARLEVTARCAVDTGIGGGLLRAVGPGELVVTSTQPL
jgi:Flp pilus assembly protein TadG